MLLLFQCKSHQQQQYPWMEAAYGCECQFHLTRKDEQQHETEQKEMTKTNIATYKTPHSYFPFLNTGIWNGNKENHLLKRLLHMNMWKITMVHQKWDNTSQTRFKLFQTGIKSTLSSQMCLLFLNNLYTCTTSRPPTTSKELSTNNYSQAGRTLPKKVNIYWYTFLDRNNYQHWFQINV